MRFITLRKAIQDVKDVHANIEEREDFREYRKSIFSPVSMRKVAFDTRRINQETEMNPRRGLQFYHRSEEFLNDELAGKIKNLLKVKTATDMIKGRLGKEPEWFDSYARVLNAALDRVLRTGQQDNDFSLSQLNYINELLYMRYRIPEDQIVSLNEQELEKIILNKDELLAKKDVFAELSNHSPLQANGRMPQQTFVEHIVKTTDHSTSMIEKLLQEVKASKENRDVERSVTITVRDRLHDAPIEKQSSETKGDIGQESEDK